ncbi:MAG: flagellar basal body rod protein FlgB [Desulfopila sp.]|jgi:flagellar basal-body rod protein FlgB|nr:flagellar basal body rod protein FlgB [Desulfopila sp.]
MKTHSISDQSIALLKKVLDLRADNEKVIASNIANSETPGYAPARFSFEEELKSAVTSGLFSMETTHSTHFPLGSKNPADITGQIVTKKDSTGIGDQNSVSLEQEMLALSENQLLYEATAQLLNKKLSLRKYIIQGGQ